MKFDYRKTIAGIFVSAMVASPIYSSISEQIAAARNRELKTGCNLERHMIGPTEKRAGIKEVWISDMDGYMIHAADLDKNGLFDKYDEFTLIPSTSVLGHPISRCINSYDFARAYGMGLEANRKSGIVNAKN